VVLPKSVTPERIDMNLESTICPLDVSFTQPANPPAAFELSSETFDVIRSLDRNRRYNFPARLGVDIFGEKTPEELRKGVEDWKDEQRRLRVAAGRA
jgi:L-glyceraldehyde reductase